MQRRDTEKPTVPDYQIPLATIIHGITNWVFNGHLAVTEDIKTTTGFSLGYLTFKIQLESVEVDGSSADTVDIYRL